MKPLLFLLIFSINSFAQEKTYLHGMIMQSDWYGKRGEFCYFSSLCGSKCVELKLKVVNGSIFNPIFIETNNGKFTLLVDHINANGFAIVNIPFYLTAQWISIESNIDCIYFYDGRIFHRIKIKSNLNKLKNYAK